MGVDPRTSVLAEDTLKNTHDGKDLGWISSVRRGLTSPYVGLSVGERNNRNSDTSPKALE